MPTGSSNWIGLFRLPQKVFSRWEAMLVMCVIDFVGGLVRVAGGGFPFLDLAVNQMTFVCKFIVMAENRDTLYIGGYGSNADPFSDKLEDQTLAFHNATQSATSERSVV